MAGEGGESTLVPGQVAAVAGDVPGLYVTATLYVRRGACALPGQEADDADTFVDEEHVAPNATSVSFDVVIPPLQLARPLGPLQRWCTRVVYRASIDGTPEQVPSPYPMEPFSAVRIAHQDGPDDLTIRPFVSTIITGWGPPQGAGPDADLALYDDDQDGIPNLRELQLALRPTVQDTLEPLASGAPVTLPQVTLQMGVMDGFPTEGAVVSVPVAAFSMDGLEVTNRQYRVCMGLTDGTQWTCAAPVVSAESVTDPLLSLYPVVGVAQQQARAFCAARDMDLPTEVQWERAARVPAADGSQALVYPWGATAPARAADGSNPCSLGRFILYSDANVPIPCSDHPGQAVLGPVVDASGVAVRAAQVNGIHDLAGSVAEWTLDRWNRDYHEWIGGGGDPPYSAITEGGFTTRGGSFRSGERFVRGYARSPVDDTDEAARGEVLRAVGFRCVGL